MEEIPLVVATEAAKASDGDTTESGLEWDANDYIASIATALLENNIS